MKAAKVFGLAIAAMLLTMAIGGVATASAESTTLCTNWYERPCPESKQNSAGPFEAKSGQVTLTTNVTTVTCGSSVISGETTAASGDPLPVDIVGWTLSGCTQTAGSPCKATPLGNPADGGLNWVEGTDGTFAIGDGGSGAPGWAVKCGYLINCNFTFEPTFDVSDMAFSGQSIPLNRSGGFCPESATFTGAYLIKQPEKAYLAPSAGPEPPPAPPTTLCKVAAEQCASGDRYASGLAIQASSGSVQLGSTSGWPSMTCTSDLSAEAGATGEGDLPVQITEWTLDGCKTSGGSTCTMTASGVPAAGSASWLAETNGVFTIGDSVSWNVKCGFSINCNITFTGTEFEFNGGQSAQLALSGASGKSDSEVCLGSPTLTATYTVDSPEPLYVAHT